MKYFIHFAVALAVCFAMSRAEAQQNKVVVISMGSNIAKGSNGQVQYNDEGMTAGAEVYYDKATGKLNIPGELRITDDSGNPRLWGEGRPGTNLINNHTNPTGYCETSNGTKFALSKMITSWSDSAAACPIGTWVCSHDEIGETDCDVTGTYQSGIDCQGSPYPISYENYMLGWLTDADSPFEGTYGRLKNSNDFSSDLWRSDCYIFRVWCCWQ